MRRSPKILKFKRFQFTAIALTVGIALKIVAHIFDFDYFEHLHDMFERYEDWELDELFMVFLIVGPGMLIDYLISRSQMYIQKRQFFIFRSTMYNVNHTVNNLLNQLQYFYYTAAEGRPLSPEEIAEFEKLIKLAEADIQLLNAIDKIPDDLSSGVAKIRLE